MKSASGLIGKPFNGSKFVYKLQITPRMHGAGLVCVGITRDSFAVFGLPWMRGPHGSEWTDKVSGWSVVAEERTTLDTRSHTVRVNSSQSKLAHLPFLCLLHKSYTAGIQTGLRTLRNGRKASDGSSRYGATRCRDADRGMEEWSLVEQALAATLIFQVHQRAQTVNEKPKS